MRSLGHGAYGEAWLCRHAETSQLAVVKTMNLPSMTKKELAYAQSEIQCMASVHHSNIIKFIDSHSSGTQLCIAMEFADAGDLRRHTKLRKAAKQLLTESEVMFLFVQVAIAVQHIHSCYMLHRDIKSANILILTNGLVKIADFGFSRQYEDTVSHPVAHTFCGTPYYLAPEVWRNEMYSNKAEVWSLGVLLYELLALDRPFQSPSLSGLMERITAGIYAPIHESYSQQMRHFVATLLDPDVVARPSSLELFQIPYVREHLEMLRALVRDNDHIEEDLRSQWRDETDVLLTKISGFPAFPLRTVDPSRAAAPEVGPAPLTVGAEQHKAPTIDCSVEHAGPVRKLSAIPNVRWIPKHLILSNGKLLLSEPNKPQSNRAIAMEQLKSAAAITLQAAQVPFVFAVHTKDAKCTWLQADSEAERQMWLQRIQQAMGVFSCKK
jgi:serine/threonine protein kinase